MHGKVTCVLGTLCASESFMVHPESFEARCECGSGNEMQIISDGVMQNIYHERILICCGFS